jgi:uncharacterized protein
MLMELVPHRTLPLNEGELAILSEESNAWAIMPSAHYNRLQQSIQLKRRLPEQLQLRLYEGGLLRQNGQSSITASKRKLSGPRSLLLKLTGACNIFCDYCYDYDRARWKSNLTFEKIKHTLDSMLEYNQSMGVVFHGGEPLLRFDLVKEVVEYASSIAGKQISFSIQTNASLLDEEIVQFLEEHNFSVGISIDGHTEEMNRLRKTKGRQTACGYFLTALEKFPAFLRKRCGVLSVVSKANVKELPGFALWLQQQGILNLGLSFMDKAGKGMFIPEEKVTYEEATALMAGFCELVESGALSALKFTPLTSRVSNLYQYHSKDFCHKGPCAASDEFLVLDAEGNYRTCDSTYHPFFLIGADLQGEGNAIARNNIPERHAWLKTESLTCSKCPLLSLCGGTCAAKAIASNGDPYSIDVIECAISKYLYPRLLQEFSQPGPKPLHDYYKLHEK